MSVLAIQIYLFCQAQIMLLLANKAFTNVLPQYLDYIDNFLLDNGMELLENTSINEHIIELIESKQLLYKSFYSLRLVELETLKIYT